MQPEKAHILIAEPDRQVQSIMKMSLQNTGYRTFTVVDTVADVKAAIIEGEVDLLITEATLGDGPSGLLVRDVRQNNLGSDPFLPIIATVTDPGPDLIRALVDVGPDDLMIKPFSAKTLAERIERIVQHRKPFVVTYGYVGPDRRTKVREDAAQAMSFVVPNRLAARVEGKPDERELRAEITRMTWEVMETWVQCLAKAIVFKLDRGLPNWTEGTLGDDFDQDIQEVVGLAQNAGRVIGGTRFDKNASLILSLYKTATAIRAGEGGAMPVHLAELEKLNSAFKQNFSF